MPNPGNIAGENLTHFLSDVIAGARETLANAVKLAGGLAGRPAEVQGVGDDTNITIKLTPKGTGLVVNGGRMTDFEVVDAITTDGAVLLTTQNLLDGVINRSGMSAGRADTTPTAAQIVAAIPGAMVNTAFKLLIRNINGSAFATTLTAGANVTISGTAATTQNQAREWLFILTNVGSGTETVTAYSLGAAAL